MLITKINITFVPYYQPDNGLYKKRGGEKSPLLVKKIMISQKKVEELVLQRIQELDNGIFIVEISVNQGNVIHVEIDKHEGFVSINDCMSISRNVEHNLDREVEDFEINVSSSGLDKGLRILPQYVKNIGKKVKVKLNNGKKIEGKLTDANKEAITLQTTRKERIEGKKKKETIVEDINLPMSDIKETKIVISFK